MTNAAEKRKKILESHGAELTHQVQKQPFAIFLCGPALASKKPSAELRKRIQTALESRDFEVFLGEDDGLETIAKKNNFDAQSNELNFIRNQNCKAVILIADSVGSQCELGLFSWLFSSNDQYYFDKNKVSFFVIADVQYEGDGSYFIHGPIQTLKVAEGSVEFSDFNSYDVDHLVEILAQKRARAIQPLNVGG